MSLFNALVKSGALRPLDQALRLGGVEAGVAGGDGQRGQGGGGEHGIRGVRVQPAQALGQGVVEGAQGAGFGEGLQQAHAAASLVSPANRASSACTSSGSKRQAWMPCPSLLPASMPRQNR